MGERRQAIEIVSATPDDVALILRFIQDLAAYEGLSHEVRATEDALRASLFGPQAHAEVVLARLDTQPVGFALFFHNYSTFLAKNGLYLEDLYVTPEARGHGVGRAVLRHLAGLARARDCGRLEWWVLDSNHDAIRFYESLGAEAMSDWTVYRLAADALTRLAH